jgi:hypothetical protein
MSFALEIFSYYMYNMSNKFNKLNYDGESKYIKFNQGEKALD